jgi:hypothetical protein
VLSRTVAESSHREFYRVEHCHILRPLRAIPQIVDHSLKPLLPFGVRLTLAQSADQLSMSTRDGDPGRLAGDVVGNHTIQRFGQRLDHFLVFRRSSRGSTGGSFMVLCMVTPHLKKPVPKPPVERPVRRFSDCMDGGSYGALRSLGLVGVALRKDEFEWLGRPRWCRTSGR